MRTALSVALLAFGSLAGAAELPRIMIDTSYTPAACTNTYTSATSLQTILNNASCGDTVCLTAGNTWTGGSFTIPDKSCSDTTWVVVRTSTPDSQLPAGRRVGPSDVSKMATITGSVSHFFKFLSGADHYRFIGLEFVSTATDSTGMIDLDSSATEWADHITFDRVYIRGNASSDTRNGINLGGIYISVIDSYITDILTIAANSESHGILFLCGPGPYKVYNNRIQATGENFMTGGGGCSPGANIPADIYIARNWMDKKLTWDGPTYTGKNLFEMKSGRRALIENNLFENMWITMGTNPQNVSINFKAGDDTGCCHAYIETHDITFRNNIVRHAHGGLRWTGYDGTTPVDNASYHFDVMNNLFYDIGTTWDPAMNLVKAVTISASALGPSKLTFNTFQSTDGTGNGSAVSCDGWASTLLELDYNIWTSNDYGVKCDSIAAGNASIAAGFPDSAFLQNVITTCPGTYSSYPTTACPANDAAIGFVNLAGNNFRLDASSAYDTVGPGGRDLGVHVASAGLSWLDLEVQQSGTSAILRFGRDGLAADATCTVRKGATEVASTSGGARREVVVTGLTNLQSYYFSVDCGDQDGDIDEVLYTAVTPSGGDRTIPIQLPAPPSILTGAARATLDYDDNAALSTPTNTQNTSCGSGCTINLVAPAGVQYYRWRWQNASDTVLATSAVQPILVQ